MKVITLVIFCCAICSIGIATAEQAATTLERVFTKANGEVFLARLASADTSSAEVMLHGAGTSQKMPLAEFGPTDAAYIAAWKPDKAADVVVHEQVAALWKGIASRKPDTAVVGAGKPVLALIETWRLPKAFPQPAYWRAKPLYISADGLTVFGEYSEKDAAGSGKGLFRWRSGKGVEAIQPAELPKELNMKPGTKGAKGAYLLEAFAKHLELPYLEGYKISGITSTWGCSSDGRSYAGGTNDDWPQASINGRVIDLEYFARVKLGLRTKVPWYVCCPAGAKPESLPILQCGAYYMSKATAISVDGKTIAGLGEMGAWVLHSPGGFENGSPEVTLQSEGDVWRSTYGRPRPVDFLQQAGSAPGVAKIGLAGPEGIEELLSAYFPERSAIFVGGYTMGTIKIADALAQIAAKCPPLSEVDISFTPEEKALAKRRLLQRLRWCQDNPEYSRLVDKLTSELSTLDSGIWPAPPPLGNQQQLKEWCRLSRAGRNFVLEFPDAGVTGKGGMADVMFRLKLMAGLQKAKATVGDEVWKEWNNPKR